MQDRWLKSRAERELWGASSLSTAKQRQMGFMYCAGGDEEDMKDRTKQKACLERYRKACIEILGVLNKAAPQASPLLAPHACIYCAMT